jgi:hypothetical protein
MSAWTARRRQCFFPLYFLSSSNLYFSNIQISSQNNVHWQNKTKQNKGQLPAHAITPVLSTAGRKFPQYCEAYLEFMPAFRFNPTFSPGTLTGKHWNTAGWPTEPMCSNGKDRRFCLRKKSSPGSPVVQPVAQSLHWLSYTSSPSLVHMSTKELTPCSTALLDKLIVPQLVVKFPVFYGTRKFITAFTTASHLFLFWDRSIQSTSCCPVL